MDKDLVLYLFAGMFAFNSLPHLISGLVGNRHMTPFSKQSSAVMNVLWGFVNLAVANLLLSMTTGGLRLPDSVLGVSVFLVGGLIISIMCASLFSNPNAKMPWWK